MTDDSETNTRSPSQTTVWKYAKIAVRPKDPDEERSQSSFRRLPWARQTDPINCTIEFRGGPQCWWEIRARGAIYRVTGDLALHDVMSGILSGELVGRTPETDKESIMRARAARRRRKARLEG